MDRGSGRRKDVERSIDRHDFGSIDPAFDGLPAGPLYPIEGTIDFPHRENVPFGNCSHGLRPVPECSVAAVIVATRSPACWANAWDIRPANSAHDSHTDFNIGSPPLKVLHAATVIIRLSSTAIR